QVHPRTGRRQEGPDPRHGRHLPGRHSGKRSLTHPVVSAAECGGGGRGSGALPTPDQLTGSHSRRLAHRAPGRFSSGLLPMRYRYGMSKQIAVRLPEKLVDFVDRVVASGEGPSRAAVVARALEREQRRALAERDARILAREGPDPELAGLAEHAARLPPE